MMSKLTPNQENYAFLSKKIEKIQVFTKGRKSFSQSHYPIKRMSIDPTGLLSLILGILDPLKDSKIFFFDTIYKNAQMSKNRKEIESFTSELSSTIRESFKIQPLPMPVQDIVSMKDEMFFEIRDFFSKFEGKNLKFSDIFIFYQEISLTFEQFFIQKIEENSKVSESQSDICLNELLKQIPKIENLSEEDLLSPTLVDDFEAGIQDITKAFEDNTQGPMKCKHLHF